MEKELRRIAEETESQINKPEFLFREKAKLASVQVSKKGWPDFIVFDSNGDPSFVVETKTTKGPNSKLRPEQAKVMAWLSEHGIPCYVSDGHYIRKYNPLEDGPFPLDDLLPPLLRKRRPHTPLGSHKKRSKENSHAG